MLNRQRMVIIIGIIFICMSQFTFAAENSEIKKVELLDSATGQTDVYETVNLMINGQKIISDLPSILYKVKEGNQVKSRTLVPVRIIAETLGAEVKWDGATEKVSIFYDAHFMELTINSDSAIVDGITMALPNAVPAKLMNYKGINRTLVPVRFVTEQFGLSVDWVGETRTVELNKSMKDILDISYDETSGFPEIVVLANDVMDVSAFYLDGSLVGGENKLVVDIANAALNVKESALNQNNEFVLPIEKSGLYKLVASLQEKGSTLVIQLEISMNKKMGYQIEQQGNRVRIQFVNAVEDITIEDNLNKKAVVIKTTADPTIKVSQWQGKAIVDVLDAKMNFFVAGERNLKIAEHGVDSVSFSQLDSMSVYGEERNIARVVVNLENPKDIDKLYVDQKDNYIYVYLDGNPLKNIQYTKDSETTSHLIINGNAKGDYHITHDKKKSQLKIYIDKAFSDLNNFKMQLEDNIVQKMNVEIQNEVYVMTLDLATATVYKQKSTADDNFIELNFVTKSQNALNSGKKLIVIDPGHGGKDPGAISPLDDTMERDVVFDISLRLKQELEKMGFLVYLTRQDDVFIGLYERAEIANQLVADAFLSIHANAAESVDANGVEIIYTEDKKHSISLAGDVLKSLAKATGAKNRGLREIPEIVVVRETLMPSILVEVGFLSNPYELLKLKSDKYKDSVAKGIAEGIKLYFRD